MDDLDEELTGLLGRINIHTGDIIHNNSEWERKVLVQNYETLKWIRKMVIGGRATELNSELLAGIMNSLREHFERYVFGINFESQEYRNTQETMMIKEMMQMYIKYSAHFPESTHTKWVLFDLAYQVHNMLFKVIGI